MTETAQPEPSRETLIERIEREKQYAENEARLALERMTQGNGPRRADCEVTGGEWPIYNVRVNPKPGGTFRLTEEYRAQSTRWATVVCRKIRAFQQGTSGRRTDPELLFEVRLNEDLARKIDYHIGSQPTDGYDRDVRGV